MVQPADGAMGDVALLHEHQARIACHVCGRASAGPFCGETSDRATSVCHWEMSRDLVRCQRCQQWSCETHIRNFGYDVWWLCIVCFLEESARIAAEAGDATA